MKSFILLLFGLLLTINVFSQAGFKFSPNEVKQDFELLYQTLKETHYNLFINISEKEYDDAYEKTMLSITDSLQPMEVYRKFQPFVALSGVSRCLLDYPLNDYFMALVGNDGELFPLDIQIEQNKVYVKSNYSDIEAIKTGQEILSINDRPIQDVMDDIYNYLSGESNYYKGTIVNSLSFPLTMWILEDPAPFYTVKIKDSNGKKHNYTLKAVLADDFLTAYGDEEDIFEAQPKLDYIEDIAYFKIGIYKNISTSNIIPSTILQDDEFLQIIDSYMKVIETKNCKNLIIDLRDIKCNPYAALDSLVAYFADRPFSHFSEFKIKTNKLAKEFFQEVDDSVDLGDPLMKEKMLTLDDGEIFEYDIPFCMPKPDSLRFKGEVYFLINRNSFGPIVHIASVIQDYGFGKIIGEETADVTTKYSTPLSFTLPNTDISVSIPITFASRPNGDMTFKGVVPDYIPKRNVFSEEDEILDFAIDLITNQN